MSSRGFSSSFLLLSFIPAFLLCIRIFLPILLTCFPRRAEGLCPYEKRRRSPGLLCRTARNAVRPTPYSVRTGDAHRAHRHRATPHQRIALSSQDSHRSADDAVKEFVLDCQDSVQEAHPLCGPSQEIHPGNRISTRSHSMYRGIERRAGSTGALRSTLKSASEEEDGTGICPGSRPVQTANCR